MRVVPGLEPESAQEARVASRRTASSGRRHGPATRVHPLQARRAAAAGEPQQHGLGLVVEGVAEQHGDGAGRGGGLRSAGSAPPARRPRGPPRRRRRRRTSPGRARAPSPRGGGGRDLGRARPGGRGRRRPRPARSPARGASKAVAAARARESAPPLSATSTQRASAADGAEDRRGRARTARRTSATAGVRRGLSGIL